MQLFRTIFLGDDVWLALVEYPDTCPECKVPTLFDEYGVHEAAWDTLTLEEMAKARDAGKYVRTLALAKCLNGHPLQGVMSLRASTGQEAEVRMEYVCLASTLARSHPEVAEILDQTAVVRAAPGIFMPKGSLMTTTDGIVRPVILGEECDIASSSLIGPLTFIHKSRVGPGTRLSRCVVIESTIEEGAALDSAVIIRTFMTNQVESGPDGEG